MGFSVNKMISHSTRGGRKKRAFPLSLSLSLSLTLRYPRWWIKVAITGDRRGGMANNKFAFRSASVVPLTRVSLRIGIFFSSALSLPTLADKKDIGACFYPAPQSPRFSSNKFHHDYLSSRRAPSSSVFSFCTYLIQGILRDDAGALGDALEVLRVLPAELRRRRHSDRHQPYRQQQETYPPWVPRL